MKNKLLLFLKGILMGICDLVPGISGGTIAFITGIYERLINAVKGFSLKLILSVGNKDKFKTNFKKLDLGFLIVLLLGIFTALILGSGIIEFLLENYFVYTLSFFIGLILMSSFVIFEKIRNHNSVNVFFGILGFVLGLSLIFLVPAVVNPSLGYVFFGGFVAISAMFLPGISGAFILLILGLYEFMLGVLHDISRNINYFLSFVLGAILGAFVISRVISYLFKKDRCKTLYFLLGLVLGALSVPIKRVSEISVGVLDIGIMLFLFLIGVFMVLNLRKYGKRYEDRLEEIENKFIE